MANINRKEEPSTAPQPDQWYNLRLGSSFKDDHPSSKFCTLRYEFKPASIDKNQPGKLHKTKDNRVSVEFQNNQPGKPKVTFDGSIEDHKENDAVLIFDGESFRLERLHRLVKRLRYNRLPGESAAASAPAPAPAPGPSPSPAPVGIHAETSSSPVAKGAKFPSLNKPALPVPSVPVEVERIEVGDFRSSDSRPKNEKIAEYSSHANQSTASPDMKSDDQYEHLDILNDDDDDTPAANSGNIAVEEFKTGIDINIPHQDDMDDEIADVDLSDDDEDKGCNAAEELRAQVNAEGKVNHTSSSSSSSGSDSSGSGTGSGSGSGSGSDTASSSSDNESSDTVNSI